VRQALVLLSDEPSTAAGPMAGEADGRVPSAGSDGQQVGAGAANGGDDDDTFPMPVILPGSTATPRSGTMQAQHRGPFEPAQPSPQNGRPEPKEPDPADSLSPAAAAKLDQIKDLLITAEAIGEQNLNQHFDQVRQRQQELIREFFDEAIPDSGTPA
jgi:hypothetical protein